MKIKKLYSFSNKKQIWRLLPTNTEKLVIEERDTDSKEVFFSCLELRTGKKIFNKMNIAEKFWVGIENIYNDIIFFHRFRKPDMPEHRGIIAFDIMDKKFLWENDNYIFLFIYNDELFSYKQKFEGREFFKLNCKTGELLESLGDNADEIKVIKEKNLNEEEFAGYHFSKQFNPDFETDERVNILLSGVKNQSLISGKIDYISFGDFIFYGFHEILPSGKGMKNIFRAVDINNGKVIFKEELNRGVINYVPDSFFIKDDLLFLLKEKTELLICSII